MKALAIGQLVDDSISGSLGTAFPSQLVIGSQFGNALPLVPVTDRQVLANHNVSDAIEQPTETVFGQIDNGSCRRGRELGIRPKRPTRIKTYRLISPWLAFWLTWVLMVTFSEGRAVHVGPDKNFLKLATPGKIIDRHVAMALNWSGPIEHLAFLNKISPTKVSRMASQLFTRSNTPSLEKRDTAQSFA